ncbi:MAG TPA: nucleotidyltransferase domain-containing protein, partial [Rhodobacteraceae bacterium]|nr:nucleotidyltransferase domain-containing protein [Paracoccaceae bacterium]
KAKLAEIAAEEDIRILLAIESGSRAWGFHSPDSDYDVRFIYTRPLDWHLKLGKKRDVVERPIDDELDLSGWELSKALTLALSSNAVIGEWLQSPIRYIAEPEALEKLLSFTSRALSRKSVSWHYLSLLKQQQKRLHNPDGSVRLKRYFYTLRPTLALRWMRLHNQPMPPMAMAELVAGCALSVGTQEALTHITVLKMKVKEQAESAETPQILNDLIAEESALAEAWLATAEHHAHKEHWQQANQIHKELTLGR